MTDSKEMTVAVDGATGYVGSHLVHALRKRNVPVSAIIHENAGAADRQFIESCGAGLYPSSMQADSKELIDALAGAKAVVHLIGSIAPPKGQSLAALHAGITEQLVQSCRKSGTRIIMVTALGSSQNAGSEYHRTKWQAEQVLRASGLPYVILRPSLIIGRQVGRRDSKLMARYMKLIEKRPKVPLIAGGSNRVQPVFIGDLVQCIIKAIDDESLNGKTLEIGGPEIVSMKELVLALMEVLSTIKPFQPIPPALASVAAYLLEMVQTVPLISRDQVKLAQIDNICGENALLSFVLQPCSLADALSTYRKNVT